MTRFSVLILLPALLLAAGAAAQTPVSGTVTDRAGKPLAGVHVRLSTAPPKGSPISSKDYVVTGLDGRFLLSPPAGAGGGLYIGLGKPRYLNTGGYLNAGTTALGALALDPVSYIDNEHYRWVKPFFPPNDQSDIGCNACHGEQYTAWKGSSMAGSAVNPRVHSLYEGKNLDGNLAGDGYRVENPGKAGPCANCHAPAAAIDAPYETVLTEVSGTAKNGVFCDVCHRVAEVRVGAGAGVGGALVLYRSSAQTGLFAFGPYDDSPGMPMRTAYSELHTRAQLCAGCHEWTNDQGVPVLETFSEWSEMSGADPDALQCQDCHMKQKFGPDYKGEKNPVLKYVLDNPSIQGMHGIKRWSDTTFPHVFRGGLDFATIAADLGVEVSQEDGAVVVKVTVVNVNAGHALPTGMPFRHMILLVDATAGGTRLTQTEGPVVPDYGGQGGSPEDFAGRPGFGYAKVLGDGKGGRNTPFWSATEILEDTRIRAAGKDVQTFRFQAPEGGGKVKIDAMLVYRRAFRKMNTTKKWGLQDQLMAMTNKDISVEAPRAKGALSVAPEPEGARRGGDQAVGCSSGRSAGPLGMWIALTLAGLLLRRRRGLRIGGEQAG